MDLREAIVPGFRTTMAAYDSDVSPLRFGIVVGLWVAMLAAAVNIRTVSNDNFANVLIPVSLVREGNLDLDEFGDIIDGYTDTVAYWAVPTEDGIYSRYPIWAGVAAAPVFAPFAMLDMEAADEAFWLRVGRLAAMIACALFAGLVACTLRRFMPGSWAALLTMAAVMGTTVLHLLGSNLSNQTVALVCVAGLLALLTSPRMNHRRALAAGLLAGLSVASRLPVVFVALCPLGVFLSRSRWRRYLSSAALGVAVFPVLTAWYHTVVFGGPLATGYGAEPGEGFGGALLDGLAGLAVSPTCGLFVYSPFLLLGVAGAYRCFRQRAAEMSPVSCQWGLGRWVVLGIVGQWLLFSKWWAWSGALTYGGARMLAECVPGLVLLIGLSWRADLRRSLLVTAAFSVFVYLVGTVTYDVVAPMNVEKPPWDIREGLVAFYLDRFGFSSLLLATLRQGALLVGVFVVGGYMAGRLLGGDASCTDQSPERKRAGGNTHVLPTKTPRSRLGL